MKMPIHLCVRGHCGPQGHSLQLIKVAMGLIELTVIMLEKSGKFMNSLHILSVANVNILKVTQHTVSLSLKSPLAIRQLIEW